MEIMNKYKCDICKQMINNSHTTKKHMICGRCMRIAKSVGRIAREINGRKSPRRNGR